jgi:radical SAM superfamily enzyme YgiQ (UPF0313 family)
MRLLAIHPRNPDTFWSFKHALKFIGKKAALPPLGLVTVCAYFPESWDIRVIDMNCESLTEQMVIQSDYVLISAMAIQKDSVNQIIELCRKHGKCIIAGGPLFTLEPEAYHETVHIVSGEAEDIIPELIEDMQRGTVKAFYKSGSFPDITKTRLPRWELLKLRWYHSMSIQYSRGCPFSCEFCDIAALNGKTPRVKTSRQIVEELEALYKANWKGAVFFVDDNFIGMRGFLKKEVLPDIISWQLKNGYPFSFYTETSIDLAGDKELMDMMVKAGFDKVFIGIESPDEESLKEAHKYQNLSLNLEESVKVIQAAGMEVQAGFILGFDHDRPGVFKNQFNFIQKTGILSAMVGLLNAPKGSKLYERLRSEGRLLSEFSGNNVASGINFVPKMNMDFLRSGYENLLESLYTPIHYYERLKTFLKFYSHKGTHAVKVSWNDIKAFIRSMIILGIIEKERKQYWRLFFWTLFRKTKAFPKFISLAISGYHYRKITDQIVRKA